MTHIILCIYSAPSLESTFLVQASLVNIISKKSTYILIIPDKPSHLENKAVDPQEGTFLLFDVTDFQFRHIDDVTRRYFN